MEIVANIGDSQTREFVNVVHHHLGHPDGPAGVGGPHLEDQTASLLVTDPKHQGVIRPINEN